ncbi:MAG: arsenate reductase ArsC [Anaerolineales bacterium]
MTAKRTVLFLCTGNSCRSQMAEAITNARFPDWRAFSAGTHPAAIVHPMTIRVLEEIGIAHDGQPKAADAFRDREFDLVVTVCDDANEECPVWLGKGRRLHHSFPDPARALGTVERRLAAFRLVRDRISDSLPQILA